MQQNLICFFVLVLAGCVTALQISQNFAQVIDAATYNYTNSNEWRDIMTSDGILFPVPSCGKVDFPPFFNTSRNVLTFCYQSGVAGQWFDINEKAGLMIVKTINKQYGLNITARFVVLNAANGFFQTLLDAVNNGTCDVSVAATAITEDRKKTAHFQCK